MFSIELTFLPLSVVQIIPKTPTLLCIFLLLQAVAQPVWCILQDELMAWWRATLKGGGNIPSEEDLRLKAKEMKMLGV
jgi:hypothetical protein